MFGFLKRSHSTPPSSAARLMPESKFAVTVDEQEIRCRRPDGRAESVRFDELRVIIIETNDTGPLGTDVWWILAGDAENRSGCVVPGGATGEREMLEALQRLPGFDNRALIDAMSSMENRRFLCWKRGEGGVA
jgi:hypothetical protein